GGIVAVDDSGALSYRYSSGQQLSGFMYRQCDAAGRCGLDTTADGTIDIGKDTNRNCLLDSGEDTNANGILDSAEGCLAFRPALTDNATGNPINRANGPFYTPIAINTIHPRFVAIAANNGIYIPDANRGGSQNLVTIVGPATTGITQALAHGATACCCANQEVVPLGEP